MRNITKIICAMMFLMCTSVFAEPKININTASKRMLMKMNGISESIAKEIIAYRRNRGQIRSIYELKDISGIGPKRLETLKLHSIL